MNGSGSEETMSNGKYESVVIHGWMGRTENECH